MPRSPWITICDRCQCLRQRPCFGTALQENYARSHHEAFRSAQSAGDAQIDVQRLRTEWRLRCAYFVTCVGVVKDERTGEVVEVRCT
jgi:hypothetical protein